MPNLTYQPLGDGPVDDLASLFNLAFGTKPEFSFEWIEKTGRRHYRRVSDGHRTLATIMLLPMGAYFGGQLVSLTGIAGVAVAPEARGKGVARWMMQQAVAEMAASGVAVSGLYSAMHALYRACGYEIAGSRYEHRVPMHLFPDFGRKPEALAATPADKPRRERLASAYAAMHPGHLERIPYIWSRVERPRGAETDASNFIFESPEAPGELEASVHVLLNRPTTSPGDFTLAVSDVAATTSRGWQRVSSFLRGFTSIPAEAVFHGGPVHPLLALLPDRRFKSTLVDHWMLRIVDAPTAIAQRGFARGLNLSIPIHIDDALVPANGGVWTLHIADGRGTLERRAATGAPEPVAAHLSARGLAPLFTGFLSATQLTAIGLANGDPEALARLDAAFAGPAPSTPDFY